MTFNNLPNNKQNRHRYVIVNQMFRHHPLCAMGLLQIFFMIQLYLTIQTQYQMARHHSEHQPMGKGQTRPQRGGNGNGYAIINVNPPENVTMCIKYKTGILSPQSRRMKSSSKRKHGFYKKKYSLTFQFFLVTLQTVCQSKLMILFINNK